MLLEAGFVSLFFAPPDFAPVWAEIPLAGKLVSIAMEWFRNLLPIWCGNS